MPEGRRTRIAPDAVRNASPRGPRGALAGASPQRHPRLAAQPVQPRWAPPKYHHHHALMRSSYRAHTRTHAPQLPMERGRAHELAPPGAAVACAAHRALPPLPNVRMSPRKQRPRKQRPRKQRPLRCQPSHPAAAKADWPRLPLRWSPPARLEATVVRAVTISQAPSGGGPILRDAPSRGAPPARPLHACTQLLP